MKRIARVFPRRTANSPIDEDSYFGLPEMYMPEYDEVHISTIFTWDIERSEDLKYQWESVCEKVLIGGPAFRDPGGAFSPGMYVKKGITITSRGCNNNCSFCSVHKREGSIRELKEIHPGNIVQDNNLLQCSRIHVRKVFNMLKKQKGINFVGGLEYRLIKDPIIEDLRALSIKEIWIACDTPGSLNGVTKKIVKLRKYFAQWQIRCYVIIGKDIKEEESRLTELFYSGCLPFAQLFKSDEEPIEYSKEWKRFQKVWSRPCLYKNHLKEKANDREG